MLIPRFLPTGQAISYLTIGSRSVPCSIHNQSELAPSIKLCSKGAMIWYASPETIVCTGNPDYSVQRQLATTGLSHSYSEALLVLLSWFVKRPFHLCKGSCWEAPSTYCGGLWTAAIRQIQSYASKVFAILLWHNACSPFGYVAPSHEAKATHHCDSNSLFPLGRVLLNARDVSYNVY